MDGRNQNQRTREEILAEYTRWMVEATEDVDVITELKAMEGKEELIEDAFYKELSFGTGGLRGTIGAGTNRLNIHTVRKASQGLAEYINTSVNGEKSIVIARDSRIKSDLFSRAAAGVFSANGIKVHYFEDIMPTPVLSFAIRELRATAGVVITASHNPKEYNGYKVYGSDGCQITTEAAKTIQERIRSVDVFSDVKYEAADSGFIRGLVKAVGTSVYEKYIDAVLNQSVLYGDTIDTNASIVYTPLNGTGLKPVMDVLERAGYKNITVVQSQADPDGTFPTCPKPNPEVESTMEEGLKVCREVGADILIATDPDADRCGIAVKSDSAGTDYRLLTANETGLLLLDFICAQRLQHKTMPDYPVFMKTIVTNDMAEKVAKSYGVETINTLTGFKFIGEQISALEQQGRESDHIFSFEESYGYLTGSYVRDKDGVLAAYLIAEMFSLYKTRHFSILERLDQLYAQLGYCLNTQHSYEFKGSSGMATMTAIMDRLRSGGIDEMNQILNGTPTVGILSQEKDSRVNRIARLEDYKQGINGLPSSNVLKFYISSKEGENEASIVIRPSGTEPKLKVYVCVSGSSESEAKAAEQEISGNLERFIQEGMN